jgi:hypothetical protein
VNFGALKKRRPTVLIAPAERLTTAAPAVYFPEVLDLARQLINTSVRRLEYDEIRRMLHG